MSAAAPSGGNPAAETRGAAIIVFDGACAMCNGWVRFLLRHDRAARYRFAAMQGRTGAALLAEHGLDPRDPSSFLLIDRDGAHVETDAIARVLAGLGGGWPVLATAARAVPRGARDRVYRWVARNRRRWAGTTCTVPSPEQRDRFLD